MSGQVADTMVFMDDERDQPDQPDLVSSTEQPAANDPEPVATVQALQLALARTRAELKTAREDLDVFSQLTSGYWWSAGTTEAGREVRAWTTRSFTRTTGHDSDYVKRLASAADVQVHLDDAQPYANIVDAVMRGSSAGGRDQAVHEFRLLGRDGSIMWVRQRLEGRGEGPGRRIHASGELITERKRTEDALGHVEARFLSLVEHAPNVIVTIDLEGTILFVNRQVPVDGREPWELIGSSVFELAGGQSGPNLQAAIAEIVERKSAHEFPLRGIVARGSEEQDARWYEVQGAPVMRGGSVVAITMILTDVTERRVAELALRRSEARWRFLWENVPDRITELDADGRIVVTNRAVGERRAEELYGTHVFTHLSPEAAGALRRAMDNARRTGAPSSYEITVPSATSGERERWWSNRVVPYVDGGARGFLLIGTDVSDRKSAERERANLEAQLRQQQKLESIGTLASGVAHEINNPIQSIMNYADLVRIRAEPGGVVADFAGEIVAETERVATIVRNLLAFARQEKEHHSPARISEVIEATLTLLGAVLRRSQIAVRIEIPEDLPTIKCRSQQIQQVFMNLIGNARDALNARYPEFDENKYVSISASVFERDGEPWVRTTVEDHGSGISGDAIDRVFDPFFSTKARNEGTGLGLSVSHGIIREHRGELEVESKPGEYTRFHVNLRVDNGWGLDLDLES
ncbi:PAS domain-containing sensor histidine kinase [Enhygromyxa salina]|nr:PAS domain S-box protein [Enhygromyxa salina]